MRVPRAVAQEQGAVDLLDVALLERGGDVDDVGREVVAAGLRRRWPASTSSTTRAR